MDDVCLLSPCQASAVCHTSPVTGDKVCSCPSGYTGDDCSEDENECQESKYKIYRWLFISNNILLPFIIKLLIKYPAD